MKQANNIVTPIPDTNIQVHLRATEPEDLDILYKIENDDSLWNLGNTNVPYSKYVLHDYIAHATNDIYADKQARMIIENNKGNIVGIADIINFDPKNMKAEVGIVIRCEYRQNGYAFAAMQKIINHALHILHLHQLYVYVGKENKASIALFQKCGFLNTTVMRDWLYDGKGYHNALLMQLFL